MILKTDREQRNYNYLELIKMYNRAVKKYNTDAKLSEKEYKAIQDELTVSLMGMDRVEEIKTDLLSISDRSTLELFEKIGAEYYFEKGNKILPAASKEEALIVYSMLQRGDFDLFLNEKQKRLLADNLNEYFANIHEKPFDLYGLIEVKGNSLCADSLGVLRDRFDKLKRAIEAKAFVKISYNYNDKTEEFVIQPVGFIYSQLDLRLRVKAFLRSGDCWTFYVSNIAKLEISENKKPFTPLKNERNNTKKLVFSFENSKGRAERIAARFSDYEKEIRYNKKNNRITYHVSYADTPTENNRIVNRLRSIGKGLTILSEEREMVKQDAVKALENYKNAEN